MWQRLDRLAPSVLGHGDARGADRLAGAWGDRRGIGVVAYPANWRPEGRCFDPGAGKRRNVAMFEAFEPDLVTAFKDNFDYSFRTGGTEHMVRTALAGGVPCQVMTSDGELDELSPSVSSPSTNRVQCHMSYYCWVLANCPREVLRCQR
jgi:hypothetical protein